MKIVLLGITGSGKSTIAQKLADRFGIDVVEADDEVIRLNNDLWPKDEKIIDKYFQVTSDKVFTMDNVLYVISWLSKKRIKQFASNGFKIIELHADIKELLKRKIQRDNPTKNEISRFKENSNGYYEVVFDDEIKPLISLSLDTTTINPEDVFKKITKALNQNGH
ncbi:hypothetical protein A2397_05245 [Candidatus Amesbacteria bacterium RIFOXYB1_FULL_44_23]|uniref:Uncharacterized protein n=1 Tax=Candidatus Amesbacteria bacterium RIFOXYB1_FULL_44_23 TaxID=1797263 RepID=A0A1F4ZR25_9BACT|nr:MAG: hypothetical protein A2397_05245 [Candidatus Amesbacteria bacterium RIFOXYB1_FULL_44_23]